MWLCEMNQMMGYVPEAHRYCQSHKDTGNNQELLFDGQVTLPKTCHDHQEG